MDRLWSRLEYVEDHGKVLTLEQVRSLPAGRFTSVTRDNLIRGLTTSDLWLLLRLHKPGTSPLKWVLQQAIGGDRTLVRELQVQYRYPALRHLSLPGEAAEVYIRVHNLNTADVHLSFALDSSAAFAQGVAHSQIVLGILYGMPLALAFSALTGWLV